MLKGQPLSQVYVSGVEAELITSPLHCIERDDALGGEFKEKIFLLDEVGNPVTAIGTEIVWYRKYWLFGPKVHKPQMVRFDGLVSKGIIRDALSIIGDKNQRVCLILSYWEYTQAVIIYKLPKGIWLTKWVLEQIEAEKASFEKIFAEI